MYEDKLSAAGDATLDDPDHLSPYEAEFESFPPPP